MEPGKTAYELLLNTVTHNDSTLYVELYNKDTGIFYKVELTSLKNDLFRLHINEKSPLYPRYEVEYALQNHPQVSTLILLEKTTTHITVVNGQNTATLYANPFKINLFSRDKLVISANARGLMRFEHLRSKPEP
jgi:alpha 1,3-glucosidase